MFAKIPFNNIIVQHVIAIVIASICVTLFCVTVLDWHLPPSISGTYLANLDYAKHGKGKEALINLVRLGDALDDGKTVVIFGSSELTSSDLQFIPYNYLPAKLGTPVFAYGHAYFQSFGIYGFLSALHNHLKPRTRLVILLSPGWFSEGEFLPQAFSEHFNDEMLLRLYWDKQARSIIRQYLVKNANSFASLTSVQKIFLAGPTDQEQYLSLMMLELHNESYLFKLKLYLLMQNALSYEKQKSEFALTKSAPLTNDEDAWNSIKHTAKQMELAHMTNNPYYVRDDYFDKYVKRIPPDGIDAFSSAIKPDAEMTAIHNILKLLREHHVHALFVMQPLNPYVYKDLNKFDEIDSKVRSLCHQYGMSYLDMYKDSSTSTYIPGTLRDVMHLGERGWVDVDEAIAKQYGIRP